MPKFPYHLCTQVIPLSLPLDPSGLCVVKENTTFKSIAFSPLPTTPPPPSHKCILSPHGKLLEKKEEHWGLMVLHVKMKASEGEGIREKMQGTGLNHAN